MCAILVVSFTTGKERRKKKPVIIMGTVLTTLNSSQRSKCAILHDAFLSRQLLLISKEDVCVHGEGGGRRGGELRVASIQNSIQILKKKATRSRKLPALFSKRKKKNPKMSDEMSQRGEEEVWVYCTGRGRQSFTAMPAVFIRGITYAWKTLMRA